MRLKQPRQIWVRFGQRSLKKPLWMFLDTGAELLSEKNELLLSTSGERHQLLPETLFRMNFLKDWNFCFLHSLTQGPIS